MADEKRELQYAEGQLAAEDVQPGQSDTLASALAKDQPHYFSWPMFRLYGIMLLVTLNCTMNGYDGSLMSSINAMKPYHDHFNISMSGGGAGIVFAIYSVGGIIGSPVAAFISDQYGRRWGMCLGSLFIVLGVLLEAGASVIGQYIAGRAVIGFGVSVAVTAAPIYLVEVAYPSWRGVFGGLYNVVGYYSGAILASWIAYGTGHLVSDWSWRLPTIVQAAPSVLVIIFVWFVPESPRWLMLHNKRAEAVRVLVKYHGFGNAQSAVVALELNEIEGSVNTEIESSSTSKWWDYRVLFTTRANLYRVWLLMLVSVFSQFVGGSVISYYMPVILQNIGITGSGEQLLLNALSTLFSFAGGIAGSLCVDKVGRRQLFLWGTFLTGLCYIPINVIAALADGHVSTGAGYTFIAFIFLYGITFSFGWTPLQALYPAEILNNDTRAKGVAFQSLMSGLAAFINQYATPVALKSIGWRTYTIFLILHFVELLGLYMYAVETKGRSLEELDGIFESRNPVKKSLEKRTLVNNEAFFYYESAARKRLNDLKRLAFGRETSKAGCVVHGYCYVKLTDLPKTVGHA